MKWKLVLALDPRSRDGIEEKCRKSSKVKYDGFDHEESCLGKAGGFSLISLTTVQSGRFEHCGLVRLYEIHV